MRLVLREYLSMLKERDELEVLIPDLLLAMGIEPLSRPGRGDRQYGVDISAVGEDPRDGRRRLFLFTLKQGNLTRTDWDSVPQGIRSSLNEIIDTYLDSRVRPEHQPLPKKIILVTNGELDQTVEQNWAGFTKNHAGPNDRYGELEFEFWGADKLAALLDEHLLDEFLFPDSAQKQVRKTIALADQNEDEPRHFYRLVDETLFQRNLPTEATPGAVRQRHKALRLLNLSANIVFHWCQDVENLRPAVFCAEHTLLRSWDWLRTHELFDETSQMEFCRLITTYLRVAGAYAAKLLPHCSVQDGLSGYAGYAEDLEYPVRTFEVAGFLGSASLVFAMLAPGLDAEKEENIRTQGKDIALQLAYAVHYNPAASAPCFDGHAIDIGLGLLALNEFGLRDHASQWLQTLIREVLWAYEQQRYFPVWTDSYDDLVALRYDEGGEAQKLMAGSTILPLLADWCVILDLPVVYRELRAGIGTVVPKTNVQMWYPDENTEQALYRAHAGWETGETLDSIHLPEDMNDHRRTMARLAERSTAFQSLSCIEKGWPFLGLMASRHFRTPLMPEYWQSWFKGEGDTNEVDEGDDENRSA